MSPARHPELSPFPVCGFRGLKSRQRALLQVSCADQRDSRFDGAAVQMK